MEIEWLRALILKQMSDSFFGVVTREGALIDDFVLLLPILETSAKSVQTKAEVCTDYTCSLYRLHLKSPESTTYLQI